MDNKTITIDWARLGALLANLSTEEQIPFFKEFANEMQKYESHYAMQMQLTYIREGFNSDALTEKQREVYKTIGWKDGE